MPPPPPPTPLGDTHANPMALTERVTLIDSLRGFALCGVFIANSFLWFGGRTLLPPEQVRALGSPLLEMATGALFLFFVNQKFIAIFGFLFGLGFSIQLSRAEAKGTNLTPLYIRRLLVLLGIGLLHYFALWQGDILHMYALVGFSLLMFYRRSDRALLAWAVLLIVVVPVLLSTLQLFGPVLLHGAEAAAEAEKAVQAQDAARRAQLLAALSSDSVWTAQMGNAHYTWETWFRSPRAPIWLSLILGRFLLGILAGRHQLLQNVQSHRPLFRRLMFWGVLVGGLFNVLGLMAFHLKTVRGVPPTNIWLFGLTSLQEVGNLALATAYVASFALLFQRVRWRRMMELLAPVGRMALTNYLLQTVVSICIYNGWGLGLIGRLPPSRSIALALGIFAVQVVFSHWWLARFRFGPTEWMWRSLTYGRIQPLRLDAREEVRGVAA